ncbi:MAG: hypothetical protein UW79_C0035G0007 [Candidatus Yanofskybacteria bacterium GW2011_GWA2_44_9]|uniref:Uncharacterized protein n=1 Tax=Candidatus Yanofskybacteria bacterium GW2011_GWA2_44_9 TaxID=1619025 RepID=A0A0G1KB02_9BACT|nr:MAG: hypothetical protein UW79_C0035G0007 [Candidatus Yanofskybacteria bacterium GW2011_GWA2_44_9]
MIGVLTLDNLRSSARWGKLGKIDFFQHNLSRRAYPSLSDLHKLIVQMADQYGLREENVLAVVAIGSAIHPSKFKNSYSIRRRFFLFGPLRAKHRIVQIAPNDFDFLVLTDRDLEAKGAWMRKGKIHLINRSIGQILRCRENGDTVSINALRRGVMIFRTFLFEDNDWANLGIRAGVKRDASRPRAYYYKGPHKYLEISVG